MDTNTSEEEEESIKDHHDVVLNILVERREQRISIILLVYSFSEKSVIEALRWGKFRRITCDSFKCEEMRIAIVDVDICDKFSFGS